LRGGGSATRVTDGDTDGITNRGKHIHRSCGGVKKSTNLPHVVHWYIEHSVGAEMCNCEADKTNYKIWISHKNMRNMRKKA
jgi:hypothetical protein